jgi:hypothetical protein
LSGLPSIARCKNLLTGSKNALQDKPFASKAVMRIEMYCFKTWKKQMKKFTFSSMVYSLIVLVTIIIIGILYNDGKLELKDIGTGLLALVSTFLGATIAFRLNEDKEKKANEEKQIQAINSALLIMIRQHNALNLLKKYLESFPNDNQAAFNMPALQPPSYNDLIQDVSSLEFLINSNNPKILLNIINEQERFYQAIESWKMRNNFYINEFQPIVSEKRLKKHSFSNQEAKDVLGERIFETLIISVRESRSHIIKSCESLPLIYKELREVAKKQYPNEKFLDYKITE